MRKLFGLALLLVVLVPIAAQSQSAKTRTVRIIVPLTPGTGPDVIGRLLSPKLSERWKVPVIVENRPGASGIIGIDAVAKAAPDGSTLLMTGSNFGVIASMRRDLPYDAIKDFAPVTMLARVFLGLVASPAFSANSVAELISLAKASPGKITYGSPGIGTPQHLAMELFKSKAGVDLVHVPYKGTAGLVTDLMSGVVSVAFSPVNAVLPAVAANRLKMLAAGGSERTPVTPKVASFVESGAGNVDVDIWIALLVPAGTPQDSVAALNADVGALLKLQDVREMMMKQGLTPTASTPGALGDLIKYDVERWRNVGLDVSLFKD
jgi:tripartite-type tricarboxylate transporter receptor subunit TctC